MTEITGRTSKGGIKTWLFRASGLARVESVSIATEESHAENGDAYALHGVCRTAAAAAGGLLHIDNTFSTHSFHITRLFIDPQTITDPDLLATIFVDPTSITSGTDITSTGVVQKNTGSINALKSAGVTLTISDGSADMTFSGGTKLHEIPVVSRTPVSRDLNGTNIIGPGGKWLIGFKLEDGSSAVDNQIVSVTVNGYIEEIDRE